MSKLNFAILGGAFLAVQLGSIPLPARAADQLVYCNRPERLKAPGAYADTVLKKGKVYRIFFHYRNSSGVTGPLQVEFQGRPGKPLTVVAQKGIADPHKLPPIAGRQAAARFLKGGERAYTHTERVRFPMTVKPGQVASGVLRVRVPDQDVRLRIHFRNSRSPIANARVTVVDTPRREFEVALSPDADRYFFRIGTPDADLRKLMDGTYGFVYRFRLTAPAGRRVRIAFSPRGGQAGMVALVGGILRQTPIIQPLEWAFLTETAVGKGGLVFTTLPFGGVFYPVELVFRLV